MENRSTNPDEPGYHVPNLGRDLTVAESQLLDELAAGRKWTGESVGDGRSPTSVFVREELLPAVDAGVLARALVSSISDEPLIFTKAGERFRMPYGGISVGSVRLTGPFDLTAIRFPHPIRFQNCAFDGPVVIDSARLGRIAFNSCRLAELRGNAVHIDGDLDLPDSRIDGIVDLRGARIGGVIMLDGALANERGHGDRALDANNAHVGEDILLRNGFRANGETCLRNVHVGGHIDCSGGQFCHPTAHAIVCDSARIQRDVLFTDGFSADGKVSLLRATIGGNVRCDGGSFKAPSDPQVSVLALDLQWATVESNLYLVDVSQFEGGLDLRDASVRGFADDGTAWPAAGKLRVDGFKYDRFTDAPLAAERAGGRTEVCASRRPQWLNLQEEEYVSSRLNPQPFVQLAGVLKAMGHQNESQLILGRYEDLRLRWSKSPGFFERLTKYLFQYPLKFVAYHGFQPLRAAVILLAWIVLSAGIFQAAFDRGQLVPNATLYGSAPSVSVPKFSAFVYAMDVVIPFLDLREEQRWLWAETKMGTARHAWPCSMWAEDGEPTFCDALVDWGLPLWWFRYPAILGGLYLSFIAVAGFTVLVQRERPSAMP